jgi:uncharacterized phage protein (TIGR01671 family)
MVMQEIEFRAYIKHLDILVGVQRINFDTKTAEVDLSDGNGDFFEYDFDKLVLMRYTGMKDKHGAKIYEKDILKIKDGYGEMEFTGMVDFENGSFVVRNNSTTSNHWTNYEVEKLGNIFENMELIGC